MTKKALLHIGTQKTGTTSIQRALAQACNRGTAVIYPLFEKDQDHNRLSTLYLPHERLPLHWRLRYPEDDRSYRSMKTKFRDFLFGALRNSSKTILSGESLSSRFSAKEAVQLRNDLRAVGYTSFHIILYVRDPADYYLSRTQQVVKSSSDLAPRPESPFTFRYNFKEMIAAWEQAFPGQLTVKLYRTQHSNDVVQDLFMLVEQLMGVSLTKPNIRANSTLSAESMKIIHDYRISYWPHRTELTHDTIMLVRYLEQTMLHTPQSKPILRPEIADHIRRNHLPDAELLDARYNVGLSSITYDASSSPIKDQHYSIDALLSNVDHNIVCELLLGLTRSQLKPSAAVRATASVSRFGRRFFGLC